MKEIMLRIVKNAKRFITEKDSQRSTYDDDDNDDDDNGAGL